MEIHEAIADFSEDLVLDYLRERSEAVGIPCNFTFSYDEDEDDDGKYTSSSDEDRAVAADSDLEKGRPGASTVKDKTPPGQCGARLKDRAKSIDSGVCLETRRENGRARRDARENEGRDGDGGDHELHHASSSHEYSARWRCRVTDTIGRGSSDGSYRGHWQEESRRSLVLAFKKGDLFAFVDVRHLWMTTAGQKSSREVHMKALSELQSAASRLPHPDVVYGAMIPEPDYSDEERDAQQPCLTSLVARNNQVNSNNTNNKEEKPQPGQGRLDERGLIMPKKLVNPCLESADKKNLHRELMFNQKMGVSVLNQKSELQKAMEKHNDKKVLKEQQKEKQASMTPFQKALDERAQKIEQMEKAENKGTENEKTPSCEFQKIHAKVRAKMEVQ
ncbi:uncharacterized protein [Panulirus ornatus]|uniref:uncharacterized protein isoform X2 n=1 Tax=Panulirus ornatus TaxID=150431 RepID=UPI003A85695B